MAHYFLAPSSAHIWGPPKGCRAYPVIAAGFPSPNDCDESDEGTACHELAAEAVTYRMAALQEPNRVGELAGNGVMFDSAMTEAATLYADYVQQIMRERGNFAPILEQTIASPGVHELNGGTPDLVLWTPAKGVLDVFDFKYGFLKVEAFENWQCLNYAIAFLDSLGVDGLQDQGIRVVLHVVQPRAPHRQGPTRTWELPGSDLRGYRNILRTSAAECLEPEPVAQIGDHCRYCEGRHVCPALRNAAASAADFASREGPVLETPESVAVELTILDDALKSLSFRHAALSEQVEHHIRQGGHAPGWTLEPGQSRLRWRDGMSDTDIFAIGDAYNIELRNTRPITPTQARKAGLDDAALDVLAERPPAGLKLVRDTGETSRKIFGANKK